MANPSPAHEPSMEEILASIRQIISEDGDVQPTPQRAEIEPQANGRRGDAAPQGGGNARQEPQRSSGPVAVAPAPAPEAEPAEQVEEPVQASAPQAPRANPSEPQRTTQAATPAPRPPAVSDRPAKPSEDRSLMSPNNGAVVHGAFSALAHTILAQNARTLEDLVAEMMRPMLKSWLDDNLPSLVERLVREEIERVSRGRR